MVVVLGGMNIDIQGQSASAFLPGDSNPGRVSTSPGGVGRNIAENLVRLGLSVELVTVLGDDAWSRELETSCRSLGIGLSGALRLVGSPASTYLCLLDPEGRLEGAVASMETMERLDPPRLAEREDLLDAADCIVVDANLPEASIAWLAGRYGRDGTVRGQTRWAADEGGQSARPLLVLDPVSVAKARRAASRLGSFDLAKPNLAEARILADLREEEDPARLAAALLVAGLGEAQISLGQDGMYYDGFSRDGSRESGRVALPAAAPAGLAPRNRSGAGDAACAALVWASLEGLGPRDRARAALAAAMIAAATDSTVNPAMCAGLLRTTTGLVGPGSRT